jgi:predicted nucleic acid-binding protein
VYDALVTEVFRRITVGAIAGVTSIVSLAEALVRPVQQGDVALQEVYRDLLLRNPQIRTSTIQATAAEMAADLRARYRLLLPDALQIAVALEARCEAFLTNDLTLKRVTELRVLVLDELEL